MGSRPSWARELKLDDARAEDEARLSRPSWARELKPLTDTSVCSRVYGRAPRGRVN